MSIGLASNLSRSNFLLILLGAASWLAYLAALGLGDLRQNTIGFEIVFCTVFVLYLAACALVLRRPTGGSAGQSEGASDPIMHYQLLITFFFALLFRLTLLPPRPTLSDDMYRYVWDGRVQASGLSPYRYPPQAEEVAGLRKGDTDVWRYINRKDAVTVYPPGAQIAYAIIWRAAGDSVTGFKVAFVIADLVGGLLLIRLLQHFGHPPERILIYLWSPLLVFEVAHAGHVDGLMLPLLVAAFWARATDRPWLLGLFLGAATMVKLFPGLLLPALLPIGPGRDDLTHRLRPGLKTLTAFAAVVAASYAVYLFRDASPFGYLPRYFNENFNMGLARLLFEVAKPLNLSGSTLANAVTFGGLAIISLGAVVRPATSARQALARSIWLIGWFTLFTQNLFSWYLLWLLPLIVLFLEPGKLLGFKLEPATAWLVFSGTIMFSYLFFIRWRVNPWAQIAEYLPLYTLLIASGIVGLVSARAQSWPGFCRGTPNYGGQERDGKVRAAPND